MQFLIKLRTTLPFKLLILVFITVVYCIIYFNLQHNSKYNIDQDIFVGIIENIKIDDNRVQITINGKEKLLVNYYFDNEYKEDFELGDKVRITGKLTIPTNNTNFNLFNYKKYLLSKKINYIVNADKVEIIKENKNLFYKIKNMIINRIEHMKNKSYLSAFILGDTSGFDYEVKKSYQSNGISHLFAISGMHVSFISGIFYFLLKKVNKKYADFIVITCLLFFSFLVSFSPSVMRSIFLMVLVLLNKHLKLNIKTFHLFIFMTCLFLIYNPYYIYNIGFLYSFVISGFLIFYKEKLKSNNYFNSIFKVSLLAFLTSFPITIYNYFEINLLSPIFNLFMVPFITFIIFPLSFLSFVFPILNELHLFFIDILENISLFFYNIDIFKFTFAKPSLIIIGLYYVIVILILRNRKYLIYMVLIFIFHINIYKINSNLMITVLDVGQGDSVLIDLPYDKGNILIDTGGKYNSKTNSISNNTIIPYLKSSGIKKLDYLIVTHGDYDHMGETINLVENFKVEKVIFNCGEFNKLEQDLIKVLNQKKIQYYSCIKELNIDDNKLYFLNNKDYGNENDNSSVIYTELNKHKFLFMGDAGVEVEEDLIEKYNLQDIDVLKVGHHGSKTSSGKEFINEITPKYSIVSVGKNNRYGHPNDGVLDNLENSKIYRTDQDGSIIFKIKNNKLEIKTYTP